MRPTQLNNTHNQPAEPTTLVDPKIRNARGNRGLSQAYEMRDLAFSCAYSLKSESAEDLDAKLTRAKALQAAASVWSDSCDRIRILRGKPLPGSLRPEKKQPKRKLSRAVPSEQPNASGQQSPNS